MKNIVSIIIVLILSSNIVFANQLYSSYIVKVKKGIEAKKLTEKIQSSLILTPIFKPELFSGNNKKPSVLTANQKSALSELSQYFLLQTDKNDLSVVESLKNSPEVISIEPNYIYRIEKTDDNEIQVNDPLYKKQWALDNINVQQAWQKATGKGVLVGVVDTGIDYYHPDLINRIWINTKEDINNNGRFDPWSSDILVDDISGDLNNIDDDGNGYADDVIGYDFVDQTITNIGESRDIDPIPDDENGHGTSVSGVIAAENNNGIGITGIAYDSRIITIRAFDATGNGESDDIAAGIVYAALQGAKALNFSFGEIYISSIVHDAIKFAFANGVVMAASSGNNNWTIRHYPSDYDEVISVGASTRDNKRGSLSNYGNRLALVAPGLKILTTTLDSGYAEKSGTSFSAPHVVASAALLFDLDSTLTPDDVSGILQVSANDGGDNGWDIEFGSGILDAGAAVNTIGKSNITINSPRNESYIDRNENSLAIIGSTICPMFDSYQVFYGEGERPLYWTQISEEIPNRKLNDTLAVLNLTTLKDTTYTIRLKINLKNNNSIEKRLYIQTMSSAGQLEFISVNPLNAYFNNSKMSVIYSITNYPSFARIKYRTKGSSEEYRIVSEYQKFTNFHTILIPDTFQEDVIMEAVAEAELPNGLMASNEFEFKIQAEYTSENSFQQKDYGFPMSYLVNDVKDFYGNGKSSVVVNDLSSGSWGNIKVYEFDSSDFYLKDSFNHTWIPKGFGDSNEDGINEIFATVKGESVLFQAKTLGSSPFSSVLFVDTLTLNFWAEDMTDINNDGKEELIAYSDTSFMAYTYKNGKYQLLALAFPDNYLGTYPGFTSGDFDNDENIEICFGNREGNIFIYEYSNGNFNLEYNDSSTFSASEQYMTSADIDNDAIPEIIIGNFGSSVPFGIEDASDPLWTYRIFKAQSPNHYELMATEHIFGVRGGLAYKNGLTTGDVDNDNIDEIVISAFPNLYVFKWDNDNNKLVPIWNYPYTYSNSAIIYDFDNNGINEIGFGTFSGIRFFELDSENKPGSPVGFKGWSTDSNSAYFEWQPVEDAEEYEILRMIKQETGGYIGYTAHSTTQTTATIDTLKNLTYYEFVVRAVNHTKPEEHSNISNFVDLYSHKPVEPISVESVDVYKLLVSFTGFLPANTLNAGDFAVFNSSDEFIAFPSTAITANDTLTVLTFSQPFEEGDYKLNIKSFRDRYNSPTIPGVLNFNIPVVNPQIILFLTKLEVLNKSKLALSYSEPIGENSSRDVSNYILQPHGKIDYIETSNENSVLIYLDKNEPLLASGKNYTLTAENVVSKTGRRITKGAGNTLGFVFYADDVEDPYVYPNPVKISEAKEIYFANLPPKAEIIIYSLELEELQRLFENDGNGGVEWDGRDKNGSLLGNGIYIFKVIQINNDGSTTESELKKFVVLP
ncbi:S8 family serine peptidase [Bacteroidota bacterium]